MKQRTISAIIMILIAVPIIYVGGNVYNIGIFILSLIALKEFLDIKSTKKELPLFITFMSYVIMTLLELVNLSKSYNVFEIDYRIIAGLFLVFLIPTVVYHDKKLYSVKDAFYLIGSIFFLGSSFSLLMLLRNIDNGLNIFIYLMLVATMTDTYAYLTGRLVGRHKMLESISPNKTWEGMIGGTIFGVLISTVFYHTVIDESLAIYVVILISLFLSIIGQFGDLVFSAIKRYFEKKDFSNLIPGHGGVLDRLDSIIFIVLAFIFFIELI